MLKVSVDPDTVRDGHLEQHRGEGQRHGLQPGGEYLLYDRGENPQPGTFRQ